MNTQISTKSVAVLFLLAAVSYVHIGVSSLPLENCNNMCSGIFKLCNQQTEDMEDVYQCLVDEQKCKVECYKRRVNFLEFRRDMNKKHRTINKL